MNADRQLTNAAKAAFVQLISKQFTIDLLRSGMN
jgi:hypothetical protein